MATKKQRKIILVVFLIIVAILILSQINFVRETFSIGVSGFSALSLSNVHLKSNDPQIGGQAWLLTVSQNGAGQSAYGTFTATDGSSGAESNDFTITTSLLENYATYPIYYQGNPIQKVEYTTTAYNPLGSLGGCNPDVWQYVYKPLLSTTAYCYKYTSDAVYGTVGSANINFQSKINVQGSSGSDSCTISNFEDTSCISNNGNVYASWVGSLVSGQSPPQPSSQNIIALYIPNSGGWILADSQKYNDWLILKTNLLSCIDSQRSTSCFTDMNAKETSLLAGKPFTSVGGSVGTTQGGQNNGQIFMQLPTQVQFQVITMRIKASFIGINIPVGVPKVSSASSDIFQTGQTGVIETRITNIGDAQGSFDVSATSCTNGFYQVGNALRVTLPKGNSQTIYIPISANVVSGDLNGVCTIKATDVNNPNNFDTKQVSVASSAISICSPGEKRIAGNHIEICEDNVWKVFIECSDTQTPQYNSQGEPVCVDKENASANNFFSNFFSGIGKFFGEIGNLLLIFRWAVLAISTLLTFVVAKNFLEDKIIKKQRDKVFVYLLAFMVAIGFTILGYAILLTTLFWIISGASLVLLILIKFTGIGRVVGLLK